MNIADTLNAASAAASGASTPAAVSASQPTKESVWALFAAQGLASLAALVCIGLLGFKHWPTGVLHSVVLALGILGAMAQIAIPITVIALASSRLGRVEASAGDKHLTMEGRK